MKHTLAPELIPPVLPSGHSRKHVGITALMRSLAHLFRRWFLQNAVVPSWLPARWYAHVLGYGCGMIVQVVLLLLDLAFKHLFAHLPFPSILVVGGASSLAMLWGIGPGLLSLVWGVALIEVVLFRPTFSLSGKSAHLPSLAVLLLVGITIIVLSSQMMQHHRRVLAMNQRMTAFLNTASHELRTPLTSLTLSLRLMQRQIQMMSTTGDITPDTLRQQLRRMEELLMLAEQQTLLQGHLINDMLDVIRAPVQSIPTQAIWEKLDGHQVEAVAERRNDVRARLTVVVDDKEAASG